MDPAVVTAAAKGCCGIVNKIAAEKMIEWVGYVNNYAQNIKHFKQLNERLISKQNDVQTKVEAGQRKGEIVADQVDKWLLWANELLLDHHNTSDENWHELLIEEEDRKAADKCCFNLFCWNPKFRHDLSVKAKAIADSIKERIDELDGLAHFTLPLGPPSLESAGQGDFCSHLQSRQEDVKRILQALKSCEKITRIGIHGMGGAGKTTLVNEVARRAESEKLFTTVVIVEISRTPDIKQIQDRIAERIGFSFDSINTIEERAMRLHRKFKDIQSMTKKKSENDNRLEDGKLLIILDNLWSKQDLRSLGIDCDLQTDPGCTVVVTSREEDVCRQMGASHPHIYKVGDLTPDEAEILFREKVGDKLQQEQEYEEIMKKVLMKCSRLPLTISIIADTLKNHGLSFWKNMDRKLEKYGHGETIGVLVKTYAILEWSYNNIDSEEKKRFFLLCCLFPPGSNILIVDLWRYGIGLDLFQYVNSLSEAIEQVRSWAEDLKSLSLLLDFDADKGEIKIHDDVREAGRFIAGKRKEDIFAFHVGAIPRWMKKKTYQQYAAITMVSNDDDNNYECLSTFYLPNLRLLRLQNADSFCDDLFLGMPKIKVLDLAKSKIKILPPSMVQLKSLKTLLLDDCELEDISYLCMLTKLHVLSMRGSNIKRLPKEVGNLINLKLLDLTGCKKLEDIPAGVLARLSQLEGLYMKDSFAGWEVDGECNDRASISELEHCLSLQEIEIEIRNVGQLANGDFPTNIGDMTSFKIKVRHPEWPSRFQTFINRYVRVKSVEANILFKEGWEAMLKKADCISLTEIDGSRWATHDQIWKSVPGFFFTDLQILSLFLISGIEYALPSIEISKTLKQLYVDECKDLKYVVPSPDALEVLEFPCLCDIQLRNLPSLLSFCNETNDVNADEEISIHILFSQKIRFPSLEILIVDSVSKTEQLWGATNSQEFTCSFPKLNSVEVLSMPQLKCVWNTQFVCKREGINFSNFKSLVISDCGSVESVCPISVAIYGLQQLETLTISDCGTMKSVISTEKAEREREDGSFSSSSSACFPQLRSLNLWSMDNLKCFYEGCLNLELSSLRIIYLSNLEKFETFVRLGGSLKSAIHYDAEDSAGDDYQEYIASEYNGPNTFFMSGKTIFPSLVDFYVFSLPEVEQVWDTITVQELARSVPKLESIQLQDMRNLKSVWGTINDPLCRGSCNCLYLNKLVVHSCPALKSVCPISIAGGLKRLEHLKVSDCTKLKQVISTEEIKDGKWNMAIGNTVHFFMLSSLILEELSNLTCFYQGHQKIEFPTIKEIQLDGLVNFVTFLKPLEECWCLTMGAHHIHDMEDDDHACQKARTPIFLCDKVILSSLKKLTVKNMSYNETIWDVSHSEVLHLKFPKLEYLEIVHMHKLKFIWRESSIYNLIASLKELHESNHYDNIIIEEGTSGNGDVDQRSHNAVSYKRKLVFSCLEELKIKDAPKLVSVLDMKNLTLPKLRILHLVKCPVRIWKQFQQVTCRSLSTLVLSDLSSLRCLFSAATANEHIDSSEAFFTRKSQLENIEELMIEGCEQFEEFFNVNEEYGVLSRLKRLKMLRLGRLNNIPFQVLTSLQELKIEECPLGGSKFLLLSAATGAVQVQRLEKLEIIDCHNLEAIVAEEICSGDQSGVIEFPLLKEIILDSLFSLCVFSSSRLHVRLPLLGSVNVFSCFSMRSFSSGELMTPQLQSVGLNGETIKVNDDVNAVLAPKLAQMYMVMKKWPKIVKHKVHKEHILQLSFKPEKYSFIDGVKSFECAVCQRLFSTARRFRCKLCNFDVCVLCAVKEDRLREIPEEIKVVRNLWPKTLQHPLHMQSSSTERHTLEIKMMDEPSSSTERHPLEIKMMDEPYTCEACKQEGLGWSYTCTIGAGVKCKGEDYNCGFKVHPKCVLDEKLIILQEESYSVQHNFTTTSTLINIPQQSLSPPEGWPSVTQHRLHVDCSCHPLKLTAGRSYSCDICNDDWKFNLEFYSFYCSHCDFDAHPNCVLEESLRGQGELDKHEGQSSDNTPCRISEVLDGNALAVSTQLQPAQVSTPSSSSSAAPLPPTALVSTPTESPVSSSTSPIADSVLPIAQAPRASLLIGGKFIESESSEVTNVINPATQEILCLLPSITNEEFNAAVSAAKEAFLSWQHTPVKTRQRIMLKLRELIQRDTETLAQKMTTEQGKTLKVAKAELFYGLEVVDLACRMATSQIGALVSNHACGIHDSYCIREPLGVCAGISGSSTLPALLPLWLFPIAVTCGNTFILKPSENDSGVSMLLARLAEEAGLPGGVLNVVYGADELVNAICEDAHIQAISFVGSDVASMKMYSKGLSNVKRIQCNTRARNYAVVMPDAKVDATLDILVMEGFGVAGESLTKLGCLIFVGNSENWDPKLVERAGKLSVNAGNEPDCQISPLESIEEKERTCGLIQSAVESGCRVLLDGTSLMVPKYKNGNFIGPTILCDVKPHMDIYKEEISGPILLCLQAESLEEAINFINYEKYVNGVFLFTSSVTAPKKFQTLVDAKQVCLNGVVPAALPFTSVVGKRASPATDLKSYGISEVEFYMKLKPLS